MPIETASFLEDEILEVLKGFSGRKSIVLDQLIGRDVGIYGGDGVELLDELEERYGVALDPLISEHTIFLAPSWIDRLVGRKQGRPNADLAVRQLIEYIASQLQLRNSS